jgi:low temperature requirement protein LtrA
VGGWERYGLWSATVVLHYATSRLAGRVRESQSAGYAVRADHFVERHGLLLLIVFGESIVAIGIALAEVELTLEVYGAAILGLSLAAVLWWSYFITDPARSEEALVAAPLPARVRLAIAGYFYAYIPISRAKARASGRGLAPRARRSAMMAQADSSTVVYPMAASSARSVVLPAPGPPVTMT